MQMNLALAIVFRLLFLQSVFSEVSVVDHTTRQLAMNDTDSLECLTDATGTVERYSCCCLYEYSSPSLSLYISHLRLVHGKDSSFSVTCGIDGCRDHFRTFSGFSSHVYCHHRSAVGVDATTEEEPDLTSPVPASFSLTAASDDYMETGADTPPQNYNHSHSNTAEVEETATCKVLNTGAIALPYSHAAFRSGQCY